MGDNQKKVYPSSFDTTGDASVVYDSDSQLRRAIIRRLLNEYRTTNQNLANAMQSTFMRFFMHDSYDSVTSRPENNRPKSDSIYYVPTNNEQMKIEELNLNEGTSEKSNGNNYDNNIDNDMELKEMMNETYRSDTFCNDNGDSFRSAFNSAVSSGSLQEGSALLGEQTIQPEYDDADCYDFSTRSSANETDFKFMDLDMHDQILEFDNKTSSDKNSDYLESQNKQKINLSFSPFFLQWTKINNDDEKKNGFSSGSSHVGGNTLGCSFNDSNRSTIDNYTDDGNSSFVRKMSKCNKEKCKLSELERTNMTANNNDEYVKPARRESKWQVFCDLYEELNNEPKDINTEFSSSPPSIKSTVDSILTNSLHSSLEKKINIAINELKVKQLNNIKSKEKLEANEYLRLKFKKQNNSKPSDANDTSTDTDNYLIRNRYYRHKRIRNTRKYFSRKFRTNKKKLPNQYKVQTSTSSDESEYFSRKQASLRIKLTKPLCNLPQKTTSPQKCVNSANTELIKFQQNYETCYKINNKLIHETIFENSDEETYKNCELMRKEKLTDLTAEYCKESSTITCNDNSENNQSFNPNKSSYRAVNNTNVSIDKNINSGHRTSSIDSIDEKSTILPCRVINSEELDVYQKEMENSSTTICLKSCDSGIGTSLTDIKPFPNVFLIKAPLKNNNLDKISTVPKSTISEPFVNISSSDWSKVCKAKHSSSSLPIGYSSSAKSKSSSDSGEKEGYRKKLRVIFKRDATVVNLYNTAANDDKPVLNEQKSIDLQKKKRFYRLRKLLCCNL